MTIDEGRLTDWAMRARTRQSIRQSRLVSRHFLDSSVRAALKMFLIA
jgi:hypothetical protein